MSGPIDAALAERGSELFNTKGCVGCHRIGGGKLVGPDLKNVSERRSLGWIIAMITHPDSMIKEDPVAKKLFQEHMTPMPNQGLTGEEARAVYEFLRRESQ